jgi:hypothetical protein
MPNASPFANNAYGVQVRPLDYSVPDAPTTKTYHGKSIVVNGNIVGRVTSWNPSAAYTRAGTHQFEMSHLTFGRPVDYVPGIITGPTIALTRTEVWFEELDIALGYTPVWNDLADQDRPFEIYEYLFRGTNLYRVWRYTGCWFQDRNEEAFTAEGDGVVRVNATIAYVSRIRTV